MARCEKTRYQYHALDENSNLVHIKSAQKGERFTCLNCGEEMVAKQGSQRKWHFAHKHLTPNCSYESYLHKLAKHKIKEWFDSSPEINLVIPSKKVCPKIKDCHFFDSQNEYECIEDSFELFNIKTYYDTCSVECGCQDFVADLLLSNSTKEVEPITLEIFVSHKCSPEKIKSGLRIVEIQITSEDDIVNIIEGTFLSYRRDNISCFNFKTPTKTWNKAQAGLVRYVLYKSNKGYVDHYSCNKNAGMNTSAIFSLVARDKPYGGFGPTFYEIGTIIAKRQGYNIKNCYLCKYHKTNMDVFEAGSIFCCLYKKLGVDRVCQPTRALECSAFRYDAEMCNSKLAQYDIDKMEMWKLDDSLEVSQI